MSILSGFTGACVRLAVERWPAEMRDDLAREWLAELAELAHDREIGSVARAWRQLTYAASLACSPAVEPENAAPRVWREELPSFGRAGQQLLLVGGLAVVASWVTALWPDMAASVLSAVRGDNAGHAPFVGRTGFDWAGNAVSVFSLALVVVLWCWFGRMLGGWAPKGWARHTRLAVAGSTVATALVVGAVAFGFFGKDKHFFSLPTGRIVSMSVDVVPAVVVWTVLAGLVAVLTGSFLYSGRTRLGWVTGVAGMLFALEVTAVVAGLSSATAVGLDLATAPAWFPMTLLDESHSGIAFGVISFRGGQDLAASEAVTGVINLLVRPLLLCSAFLLAYAIRVSRAAATVPVPAAVVRPEPVHTASVSVQRFALAVSAVGLAWWAYCSAWLTPADLGAPFVWVQEQRYVAILLTVLALVTMMAGRGPVALPAVLAFTAMLAADWTVEVTHLHGPVVAAGLLLVGVAAPGAAWLLAGWLVGRGTNTTSARRAHGLVAILAAFAAPTLDWHMNTRDAMPTARAAGNIALVVLLCLTAIVAALAARRSPLPLGAFVVLLLAAAPLLYGAGVMDEFMGQIDPRLVVGMALAVMALAATRWQAGVRPRYQAVIRGAGWVLAGVGALVAGFPLAIVQLFAARWVAQTFREVAGYPTQGDWAAPFAPGVIIVGLVLSVALSLRTTPRPPAASQREPMPLVDVPV
jgi:hypothetical protein